MPFDAHDAPCKFPITSHCSCERPTFTLRLRPDPPEVLPPLTAEREEEIRRSVPSWSTGWRATPGDGGEWQVACDSGSLIAEVPDYGEDFAMFIESARLAVPQLLAEVDRLRRRLSDLEGGESS